MNKKGKNKKGKIPNPTLQEEKSSDNCGKLEKSDDIKVLAPDDKKEELSIIGENVQNLDKKVKEERVPEILSEIIQPVVDIKDEESPKKPKRNRGKKKKGKDDDLDDNSEVKSKETTSTDMLESLEEIEVKVDELPVITPTARKKKNKKKNAEQQAEDPTPENQGLENISTKSDIKETEKEIIKEEPIKVEIADLEVKPLKKKNKNKKRNDSEKSDKEELSCTSAFHKILDDKYESAEIKIVGKNEGYDTPLENVTAGIDIEVDNTLLKVQEEKNTMLVQPTMEKAPTPIKDLEEIKDIAPAESRGKKKNKKDKKCIPKPEQSFIQDEPKTESNLMSVDIKTLEKSSSHESKIIIDEAIPEVPNPLKEDLSPKPKAKIAKPVEKKRKGKNEFEIVESKYEICISNPIKVVGETSQTKLDTPEAKTGDQDNVSNIDSESIKPGISSDISFVIPDEDEKLLAQEFELLAEKAMGKKRKKGSKVPKTIEINKDLQDQPAEMVTEQTDTKKDVQKEQLPIITEILTPQPDQQEFIILSEKTDIPIAIDNVTELKDPIKSPKQPELQEKILLTPENIIEEREFVKQTENTQKPESKSGKKRKKSPKPQKMTEVVTEIKRAITPNPEDTIGISTAKSEEITQQSLAEKVDATNITRMYDIEISCIKADDLGESCSDAIPDITYPRATSQQLLDDNNNTIIREIFPLEEAALGTTAVVQDSTIPKTDAITSKCEIIAPREEKTDLKSKMMEVNQDMEELRLSIERSLAELTSIEKSEDAIEKQFVATRKKAEKVSNLLFDSSGSEKQKTKEEKKVVENLDKGQSDAEKPFDKVKSTTTIVTEDMNKKKIEDNSEISKEINKPIVEKSQDKNVISAEKQTVETPQIEAKIEEVVPSVDSQLSKTLIKVDEKDTEMAPIDKAKCDNKASQISQMPILPIKEKIITDSENIVIEEKSKEGITEKPVDVPPVCPSRKDNKGKHKKKKGKQESQMAATTQSTSTTSQCQTAQESKKDDKSDSKTESKSDSKDRNESKEKGKQQSSNKDSVNQAETDTDYEPIENFEDALTSSIDDVNKTFEMIVKESQEKNNPMINIIAPDDEKTPVSPPKNLLGLPDIPVSSSKRDYKKEKDKIPNEITATVKIKDSTDVEKKQSKNTQTINKMKDFSKDYKINDNEEFVYKYSFRKVFLQNSCHICKKDLGSSRVPCCYCNLLFYCSNKHKDEDWPHHQALCFAVSTIGHLKDQKHIYADAKNLIGHDYRLIRMQMIVSCEKVLKRRLVPWEQEALLYPRICAHVPCREWRQGKLSDCQGCGQISYCSNNADHLPKSHSRWCKSYSLYEKLVCYQQTKGRLEPKLPTKVIQEQQQIPEKINEVLASMYEEKIDINDIEYAALTQLATAPLTAAYCHQLCKNKGSSSNGVYKKSIFTIHVVGAELQFEADALNKWEVFFLHLRNDLQELRIVLINYNLNPSNLPLELLGKIKLCENCRQNKRRVVFSFQDKITYSDYKSSDDFVHPDLVCAFNPSIQRSSVYNGKDPWPSTINVILKLKVPFVITAYTITELQKDCIRIKECSEYGYNFISEPKHNNFASVRPDRNFISDDEMPLLFKNYCFAVLCG